MGQVALGVGGGGAVCRWAPVGPGEKMGPQPRRLPLRILSSVDSQKLFLIGTTVQRFVHTDLCPASGHCARCGGGVSVTSAGPRWLAENRIWVGRAREARRGRGGLGAAKPASDVRQSPTERALSVILQGTLECKLYLRVGPDW